MSRLRSILPRRREPHVPRPFASTLPAGTFKWVRDTGLDHAVQREKNLIPLINTKNLLAGEPSKSLPLSSIADLRESLAIPHRPSDFLRRYPSVFREHPLPAAASDPTFSLTAEALQLHSDESLMFSGDDYRDDIAERLLKLIMLRRAGKLPLTLLRLFKWDLGLPDDFETSLVPHFPDYFRIVGSGDSRCLELVCWIEELAVSAMEKGSGDPPEAFPVKYSTGFEMDDEFAKWVEDWQKLPYFSPYEDHSDELAPNGDESDRWAVAVLHELLSILAPKKTAKDNVMWLGECVGMRSRFRRALIRHPGIFYVSSKNYTHTLVLKEAFKRGALVESHAMVEMRSRYIHLMNASWAEKGDGNGDDNKPAGGKAGPRRDEEVEVDGADELDESSSDEEVGSEPALRRAGKKERWDRRKSEAELVDSPNDDDEDEERVDTRRARKRGLEERERAGRGKKRGGPRKSRESAGGAEGLLTTEKKDPTFKEISRRRRKGNRGSSAAAGLSS